MENTIQVSIICNAYNHENYIRDALESFLMQKTNFKFEVLIHDDASTDKTAEVIREYEEKYPEIIKPIYQKENQYSQGIRCSNVYQYPRVKGKYIAVCEGDDYWTDPYKLQKQFDALESNPQVDICAHTADVVEAETKKKIKEIRPSNEDTIFPLEDVILGEGGFVVTNSLMYRSEISVLEHPPFRKFLSLDYTLQIHGSLRGGMLYLKDNMSAYRWLAVGSWTIGMKNDFEKRIAFFIEKQKMLKQLNEDTDYQYQNCIQERLLKNQFAICCEAERERKTLKKRYKEYFKDNKLLNIIKRLGWKLCPGLMKKIKKLLKGNK